MAAAPQYGTITITSSNGTSISVDAYFSDVANALANFDAGAGAGATSETFFKIPINGVITDFAVTTGLTDTTRGRVTINGSPTKSILRWGNHTNTINNRPRPNIPVYAEENLGIVQLA
jgi:hypothetical protein